MKLEVGKTTGKCRGSGNGSRAEPPITGSSRTITMRDLERCRIGPSPITLCGHFNGVQDYPGLHFLATSMESRRTSNKPRSMATVKDSLGSRRLGSFTHSNNTDSIGESFRIVPPPAKRH